MKASYLLIAAAAAVLVYVVASRAGPQPAPAAVPPAPQRQPPPSPPPPMAPAQFAQAGPGQPSAQLARMAVGQNSQVGTFLAAGGGAAAYALVNALIAGDD